MSAPEQIIGQFYKEKFDKLSRDAISYGRSGTKTVGGKIVEVSGLIPALRIAGRIYSYEGESLGPDTPLEGEYLTSEDVACVISELAAKNELSQ